jgi:hypothetical protein
MRGTHFNFRRACPAWAKLESIYLWVQVTIFRSDQDLTYYDHSGSRM